MEMKHKSVRRLLSVLLCLTLLLICVPLSASADGSAAKIGNDYYDTLAAAFAEAQKGDTVELLTDVTLTEQIMIEDNNVLADITLDGKGNTIYDAVSGTSTICFGSNGHWPTGVKIKDLTVKATEENAEPYCAIRLYGGSSSELTNVKVEGDYTYGINFYGTHGGTLDNCQIVSAWTNGQAVNPLVLTNGTVISTLFANDGADMNPKITIDSTSSITTLYADEHTAMIHPDSMDRVGTILEADTEVAMVAEVEGILYSTLALAIANAESGATIEILADMSADEIITVDKALTINGNGKTLTSTAGRAINIDTTAEVTINELTIVGGDGCERGVNVINQAGITNLNNVKISGISHYAVNVATSAGAVEINIDGCELTGYAALSVYGKGSTVTVTDSKLTGINVWEDNGSNSFATVAVGG